MKKALVYLDDPLIVLGAPVLVALLVAACLFDGFRPIFQPSVTVVGVAFGLITYRIAKGREETKLEVELILKFSERFDRPEMRAVRSRAARALLESRVGGCLDIEEVLNYFEEIGYLLEEKIVQAETVRAFFSSWFYLYYYATTEYRQEARQKAGEHDVWDGIETIARELMHIDARHKAFDNDRVNEELLDEASLVPLTKAPWKYRPRSRSAARDCA